MRYEDASHTGAFQGQGPIANDDTDQLAAGAKSTATGNVITGEGTQTGSVGADVAAGAHITAIAGKGGEDSNFSGGKLAVMGEYGKLSVDAEGNYVYQANKGVENVRDRFTYTLADNQGASDTASLIVEIGKTPFAIKADAQQIVVGPDGIVTLPAGVELSDIHVVGRNLVVDMPDGTQLIIIDGAVFVPQLVLGGVEVPATNVAALLVGQEIQPAAGENPPSSGGNFGVPPPPLDPGVPLGDLIPPTVYTYTPPEPQDVFDILDRDPQAGAANAILDDDAQAGGNAGGVGDDPGTNVANGSLPGSEGDGSLQWGLLASGTLPAGFSFAPQGNGDMWILQGAVHVLTVSVNPATGAYTVTQVVAIDHPAGGDENNLTFVVNYSVTDDDGDVAVGTLSINVDDDTPITTQVQVGGTVDEDGVPGGIAGGPADVAGANTVVNGSVVGLFSVGADTPAIYGLSSNTSGLPALTSNGVAVTYSVVGNTLTASAGGTPVFTLVVNANGTFTFTLLDQLDHPTLNGQAGDNTENDLSLALGSVVQITDGDGDSITAPANGLVIVVDDDTPIALQEGSSAGTVDEDGVPGGIAGGVGDVAGAATVANGSIAALFASGADAPLTFGLLSNTSGLPALTSNGVAVTYAVVGNTLTASAGANTIFTLVLQANGSWTFTLVDQLDHPTLNGQAGDDTENDLTIDFSSILQATDADGDSVGANPRALLITVDDDTPAPSGNTSTGTVDEDGVPGGIAGGPGDVAGESAVATGNASALFNSGADAPMIFGLSSDTSGLPALTSGGVAITYSVVGNTLTASAGVNPVFTFVLNANGSWTFTLIDQLDHPTLNGQAGDNTENDLSIDLSSIVLATDADGDSIDAGEGALVVTVDDDTPTASGNQVTGTVDEDGVPAGIAGGPGDVAGEATVANGSVATLFNSGADQPLSYSLLTNTSGLPALTSNGVVVTYAVVGNTLTASAGGTDVFTFVLNANGTWTFTLLDQLDHPTLNGQAGDNTENDLGIDLSSVISATDADGDSVAANAGGLVITVDDDTPGQNATVGTVQVDEDNLTGGNLGGPNDGPGNTAGPVNFNISTLFASGADQPMSVSMSTDTSGLPALTSGGVAVTYSVVGNTLTASAGVNPVFTVVLNPATGIASFTLLDQLDHPTQNGTPDDNTENNLILDLSSLFLGTDADGDSIPLDAGSYLVDVDDDTPVASTNQITGTVDEDGVLEGAANNGPGDGIAGGTGDVAGESTIANGNVSALFNAGADQPLTYSLLANTSGLPALSSGGVALVYSVVGNTLTATAGAGGEVVFTFVLNGTSGAYTFTLFDQLDHPTLNGGAGDNTENDLSIQLGSIIQATDADGDSVTANSGVEQGLVITVDDDTPIATQNQVTGTVDEDGVLEGAADAGNGDGIAGGVGDVAGESTVATGSVSTLFQSGADEPLTFSLSAVVTALTAQGLTSNGVALSYAVVGNTLTATAPGGNSIFTFVLQANGDWTFTLLDQLDHPTLNGQAGDDTENDLAINLSSIIQATDFDGDTVTAGANGLVITVDDDLPVARNDTDAVLAGGDITTGNVITGVGTTSGAAGADSTGADEPASVTGLASNNVPANSDNDPAGGGFVVAGQFGVLTMQSDGSYSYDRNDGAPGDVQDVFTYRYTDRDGDTVTATLTISIQDSAPLLTPPPAALVDDDDVIGAGGNAGGPDDDAPANTSGSLGPLVTGGDGDIDFFFSGVQPALPAGFTHNLVNSTTMQILQGATVVLTITLNNETGAYSILQNAPIIHPTLNGAAGDNTENNIGPLNVGLVAIDENGLGDSSNVVNLAITVDDDTPTVSANAAVQLDDDALAGGIAGGVNDDPNATNVSGTLAHSYGADGAGSTAYLTTGAPAGFSYALQGNGDLWVMQGAVHVLTLTVNATTGAYTVTQVAPIVHAAGLDENNQSFTISYRVTDSDGDSTDGSIVVNVDDDTPTAGIATTGQTVSLDESAGNQLDSNDVTGPIAAFAAVANVGDDPDVAGTGPIQFATSAAALVAATGSAYGADGAGTTLFSLSVAPGGVDSGLDTTAGVNIFLFLESGIVVGRVGATAGAAAAGPAAFALAINPTTGVVSMVEYLSINHPNAANADDSVSILNTAVQAVVTVTDGDGDPATSSVNIGSLISFQDSGPIMTAAQNMNIQNSGDVAHTAAFAFNLGADGPNASNDVITNVTGSATVGGVAVTNWVLTPNVDAAGNPSPETATTASYRFTFDYPIGGGNTAQATGTLVFNKAAGTYTIDLANPIQGVTTILQTAEGTLFQGYEFGSSTLDGSQPAISVTQIQDLAGTANDIYVQFTSVSEPSSGTGDDNLEVTNWVPGANNPAPVPSGGDVAWNAGQLFNQVDGWVSTSNSANGVDGDTIQGGEVLDFSLVQGANPTGNLAQPAAFAQASAMFLKFDGIGASEDMIVILKLYDPNTNTYTTRAIMVENGDIQKGPGAGPGQYSGITLDNNDGLVIIESNDYNNPGENWVIVGAQIAGSDEGVTGTAINLNSAIGAAGDSDVDNNGSLDTDALGFQSDTDNGPFKISSIGFLTTQTTPQNAQLDFNVTVTDGDGDSITQAIQATVTAAADSTSAATIPAANTTVAPVVLDLNGDGVQFLAADAGVRYDYNGDGVKEATAWAGPTDGILIHDANGNGTVDGAGEFVFGSGSVTDLEGLRALYGDTLDANDADFSQFGVWQDANSNGVVDAGEYQSLTAAGIASINLVSDAVTYTAADGDVVVAGSSTYTNTDGSSGAVADASFYVGRSFDDEKALSSSTSSIAIAAAVAAAGLAASQPAAASVPDEASHGQTVADTASGVGPAVVAAADDAAESRSALSNEAKEAADDVVQAASSGHSEAPADAGHTLDDSHAAAASSSHAAANDDQGPVAATAVAGPVAPAVAMISAEALQAADLDGNAKHNGAVEKIVAEALGQGNGNGTVDALLNAIHGGGPDHASLASPAANAVSAWDMASNGGSSGSLEMLMKVGAEMLHHDMVQPTHNG